MRCRRGWRPRPYRVIDPVGEVVGAVGEFRKGASGVWAVGSDGAIVWSWNAAVQRAIDAIDEHDLVTVIWAALVKRAAGWGWRRICAAAARPASTVRGWLTRFCAQNTEPIRVGFARLERLAGVGMDVSYCDSCNLELGCSGR